MLIPMAALAVISAIVLIGILLGCESFDGLLRAGPGACLMLVLLGASGLAVFRHAAITRGLAGAGMQGVSRYLTAIGWFALLVSLVVGAVTLSRGVRLAGPAGPTPTLAFQAATLMLIGFCEASVVVLTLTGPFYDIARIADGGWVRLLVTAALLGFGLATLVRASRLLFDVAIETATWRQCLGELAESTRFGWIGVVVGIAWAMLCRLV